MRITKNNTTKCYDVINTWDNEIVGYIAKVGGLWGLELDGKVTYWKTLKTAKAAANAPARQRGMMSNITTAF